MFENYCLRARIFFFEGEKIINGCASPRINCLIDVTHDEEVFLFSRKQARKLSLQCICILILIDMNMRKTILYDATHISMFLQEFHRKCNESIKIECFFFL